MRVQRVEVRAGDVREADDAQRSTCGYLERRHIIPMRGPDQNEAMAKGRIATKRAKRAQNCLLIFLRLVSTDMQEKRPTANQGTQLLGYFVGCIERRRRFRRHGDFCARSNAILRQIACGVLRDGEKMRGATAGV